MTRPIEFRAWDLDIHKMYQIDTLDIDGGKITFTHHAMPEDTQTRSNCRHLINYELMQFTGLLDKDNKKIFERDILKCNGGGKDFFCIVEFEQGCFVAGMPWIEESISQPELKYYIGLDYISVQVIGNIYENPELMESRRKGGEVIPHDDER